jgi:predicted nucleotidyltransferase
MPAPPTAFPQQGFDISALRRRRSREQAARASESARLHALVLAVVPQLVARYGATAAYLFGSIAAGTAHARSDVDLVVLGIGPADYWNLRHELEQALGRPLDLHTQDDDPTLVTKAIARGECIYVRHVFRNAYAFELDWERERLVAGRLHRAAALLQGQVGAFLDWVEGLEPMP